MATTILSFGEELSLLRRRLGLSQVNFGIALRPDKPVHFRTIYNWERDQSAIPHWVFVKAEELLDKLTRKAEENYDN